jgi:hypothetical protein
MSAARPDIEEAREQLLARVMQLPGVTAVGIGEAGGAPCLRVWVVAITPDLRAAIPSAVGDFPVEVRASGPIRALDDES